MTYCSNAESIGRLVTSSIYLAAKFGVCVLEKWELRCSSCKISVDSAEQSYGQVATEIIQLPPFTLHGLLWKGQRFPLRGSLSFLVRLADGFVSAFNTFLRRRSFGMEEMRTLKHSSGRFKACIYKKAPNTCPGGLRESTYQWEKGDVVGKYKVPVSFNKRTVVYSVHITSISLQDVQ